MLWSVYIIKGPPNDIYFIIEGPYDGYFTEKVSQAQKRLDAASYKAASNPSP